MGKGQLFDPNVASEAQIAGLAGMNAALVQAIVSRRPFASRTELDALLAEQSSQE